MFAQVLLVGPALLVAALLVAPLVEGPRLVTRLMALPVLLSVLSLLLLTPLALFTLLVHLIHPTGFAEVAGTASPVAAVLLARGGAIAPRAVLLAFGLAVTRALVTARLPLSDVSLAALPALAAGPSPVCPLPPAVSPLGVQLLVFAQRLSALVEVGAALAGRFASPVVRLL